MAMWCHHHAGRRRRRAPPSPLAQLLWALLMYSPPRRWAAAGSATCQQPVEPAFVTPAGADPDDPAIWVNQAEPAASLIVGVDKGSAANGHRDGTIRTYSPSGELVGEVRGLQRPNNVDVEYGIELAGRSVDVAVTCERISHLLRVFALPSLTPLDGGGLPVFAGEPDAERLCMGVGLYRRGKDGAVFVIVSRKHGPSGTYLWQYRLSAADAVAPSEVSIRLERRFGEWSGSGEIESVAVDDAAGVVFYSDETCCIRRYSADPDALGAHSGGAFGRNEFEDQREGISVVPQPAGAAGGATGGGLVIVSDQQGDGGFAGFCRSPPHKYIGTVLLAGVEESDGSEATTADLGPALPAGAFVAMSDLGHRFNIYSWPDVEACFDTGRCADDDTRVAIEAIQYGETPFSRTVAVVALLLIVACSVCYIAFRVFCEPLCRKEAKPPASGAAGSAPSADLPSEDLPSEDAPLLERGTVARPREVAQD